MRVGILVDGQCEPEALTKLRAKLQCRASMMRPLFVDHLHPKADPGLIAGRALKKVPILRKRGAGRIILLIDREDREDCPPKLAAEIAEALERRGESGISVVVKDRALENWLVADPDCFAALPARFRPGKSFARSVSPNRADSVRDAAALLDRAAIGPGYHKRHDPPRILEAIDVATAAKNSRSFRRFLRVIGDKRYRAQSKQP